MPERNLKTNDGEAKEESVKREAEIQMAHLKGRVISNDGDRALVRYSNGAEIPIERRKQLTTVEAFLKLLPTGKEVGKNFPEKKSREKKKPQPKRKKRA